MYIPRLLYHPLVKALQHFPAVLITGPRQSGKTTFLLQEGGPGYSYVSFDDPLERNFAVSDPNGFFDRFGDQPVIVDEIQYVPEIIQYLKIRIDGNREQYGRWILTGSQQFQLMKNVSELLAGRIAILELLPFNLEESEQIFGHNLVQAIWLTSLGRQVFRSRPSSRGSLFWKLFISLFPYRPISKILARDSIKPRKYIFLIRPWSAL
jgi:predicted AAA+ superfamily ATPase